MSKFHASVCDLLEDIYSFLSCTLKNEILSNTSLAHKEKIISGLISFQKEYPEVHLQFKSTHQDADGRPDSVRYSPSSPVPYVDMNGGSPYKIPSFAAQNVEGENYDLCIIKDKSANAENQSVGDSEDYISDEVKCLPDVAASDLYACEKSGYLDKKKRDSIKGWLNPFQKRWCAIQDGVMYYYEKCSDRKQRGSIVLLGYEARALSEDAKDGKKYNHCFELVCPGKRTYQFSASSETDLKQWVAAVEKNSKVTPSINVPQKRKRVVLTMKDKVNIINRLKKGETGAKLADEYKVGTSTISNIKQNSESILEYASILYNENDDSPRKMMRGAKNEQVDRAVYAWFLEARSQGQPISGPIICEKALMLNEKMG
ncbi:Src kinase-associated phosphoprotein 2, partial [Stegodyphus mimosarum]